VSRFSVATTGLLLRDAAEGCRPAQPETGGSGPEGGVVARI